MKSTPFLAAILMLGGVSFAYAQEGPNEGHRGASERGSSTTQEHGKGSDAGVSERSNKRDGAPSKESKSPVAKERAADKAEGSQRTERKNEAGGDKSAGSEDRKPASDRMSSEKSREPATPDSSKQSSSPKMQPKESEAGKAERSSEKSAESKASGGKSKQVDLSGDKRAKVQTAFRDAGNVKHRSNEGIEVAVGRTLPRDWDYVAVPDTVVEIVPEYRGYRFAYVGDEYVIVEPDSYEVVAVIPAERSYGASSGSGRAAGGPCSAGLNLDKRGRELILDNVHGSRATGGKDVSVGSRVPRGVELLRLPDSVISEAKALRGCQYFDAGGRIAIVDPGNEKIVAVIDRRT